MINDPSSVISPDTTLSSLITLGKLNPCKSHRRIESFFEKDIALLPLLVNLIL